MYDANCCMVLYTVIATDSICHISGITEKHPKLMKNKSCREPKRSGDGTRTGFGMQQSTAINDPQDHFCPEE